jgi:hypothetical protein
MAPHPVQLYVDLQPRTQRIHIVIRLLLLAAIGAIGCSSVYWILYLGLPAVVAMRILQRGNQGADGGQRYLADDGPKVIRILRWLASAYGYLWLLTDVLPTAQGSPIDLEIHSGGRPTAGSALLRILTAFPALILLMVLSVVLGLAWLVGAVFVLVRERMPSAITDFLSFVLRFQMRLAAYHLSLVDRYPSFELSGGRRTSPEALFTGAGA